MMVKDTRTFLRPQVLVKRDNKHLKIKTYLSIYNNELGII